MRDDETPLANRHRAVEQEIEVERPGRVACAACPPSLAFDRLQKVEELPRGEARAEGRGGIEVVRLRRPAYGLGPKERGDSQRGDVRREASEGDSECGAG
jgi:hypothetical protein